MSDLDKAAEESKKSLTEATSKNNASLAGVVTGHKHIVPSVKVEVPPELKKPIRAEDYGLLKAKNIVDTLLDTECLPSKADCVSLINIVSTDKSPLYYTQCMVQGMLAGADIPNKKQLNKLAALIADAS